VVETALNVSTRTEINNVVIATINTDDIDGSTDTAGAIVNEEIGIRMGNLGLNMMDYLRNNDFYIFLSRIGDLILTGPTSMNVIRCSSNSYNMIIISICLYI